MLSRRHALLSLAAGASGAMIAGRQAFGQQALSNSALPWVTPAVVAPGLDQIVFASQAAGTDVSFHVLRPPGLQNEPGRRYPTIYWLHGTAAAIVSVRPMAAYLTAAMRAGLMPKAFVVFPNGLDESMWCNSRDGRTPLETILMREIIPMVDHRFPTIEDRSHRMIEGFSMGGFGAGRLGFRYPEMFAAISMLGAGPLQPAFTPESVAPNNRAVQAHAFASVFGSDQGYFRSESPRGVAAANAARLRSGVRIRIAIGANDFTLPANRDFAAFLTGLAIPHDFTIAPGVGHKALMLLGSIGFGFHQNVLVTPTVE